MNERHSCYFDGDEQCPACFPPDPRPSPMAAHAELYERLWLQALHDQPKALRSLREAMEGVE